jgi:serine/threonine-protein kinase
VRTNQVSHYRILNKLGKGGMSEVYLAEDTILDRRVAVKFLLPELLSSDLSKKRLIREAKAIASLDHPNICAIYEVGEDGDQTFIVMQYIEGQTLAAKEKTEDVDLKESISIASQVAAALDEAHSRGIIHRDIKPQNIMVTASGLVKVLDFGLSKIIQSKHPAQAVGAEADVDTLSLLSDPGLVIGTLPYLSPEQARRDQLDVRSDIFSFGIVLYEMASGHHPFSRKNSTETILAISTYTPPPLAHYAANVPPELELIVAKCLEKNPERRYQSARELLIDLDHLQRKLNSDGLTAEHGHSTARMAPFWPQSKYLPYIVAAVILILALVAYLNFRPGPNTTINSVAVLPFDVDSGVQLSDETRVLMAWMSDSVANSLQELPSLKKVIAPSSMLGANPGDKTPKAIGQRYGVQAVLIGRVLQLGDELSIQISLIDTSDNRLINGRSYLYEKGRSNTVKGEISSRITEDLKLRLTPEEQLRLTRAETNNADASIDYQKGREYWYKRHRQDIKTSIDYFKRAIEKDPSYAKAHAGLADAYAVLAESENPKDNSTFARVEAEKALSLDNKLAEAYTSLALIAFKFDWDWPNAELRFKKAIELKPNSADAHYWYAAYLSAMARGEEAVAESKRAADLDPLNPTYRLHIGHLLYLAHRNDEALTECRAAILMNPNSAVAHMVLGSVYTDKKMYDAALAEFQRALPLTEDKSYIKSAIGITYAAAGKKAEARRMLDELQLQAATSYVSPIDLTGLQLALGEKDQAFVSLERAYQERSNLLAFLKVDPIYDSVRADQRFLDLQRRVGLQ